MPNSDDTKRLVALLRGGDDADDLLASDKKPAAAGVVWQPGTVCMYNHDRKPVTAPNLCTCGCEFCATHCHKADAPKPLDNDVVAGLPRYDFPEEPESSLPVDEVLEFGAELDEELTDEELDEEESRQAWEDEQAAQAAEEEASEEEGREDGLPVSSSDSDYTGRLADTKYLRFIVLFRELGFGDSWKEYDTADTRDEAYRKLGYGIEAYKQSRNAYHFTVVERQGVYTTKAGK